VRQKITVVVDNPSWIIPYAENLVLRARELGFEAAYAKSYEDMPAGEIAFLLGCTKIASPEVLAKHRLNLVVHESDLPLGRGFAPVAWQVIAGATTIPVMLIQAVEGADLGPIFGQSEICLSGYELGDELRHLQGEKTIELCVQFLQAFPSISSVAQVGEPTYFRRRTPDDSRLDPDKTIRQQFNLLRTVDNNRYPAFFEIDGHRYYLRIARNMNSQ
jgi:methionyl-tRNA formyltransferase